MYSPGRNCPLHYCYRPEVFARSPDLSATTLLIAGGVYGNEPALESLLRLREPDTLLVFAGDFNWFNISTDAFETVNETVLDHVAIRGNVETELASNDSHAGCGCAYPGQVDDAEVVRSNAIMQHLRTVASMFPDLTARLARLPMHLVANVGGLRIGITHGDAFSLAGWTFGHDVIHIPDNAPGLNDVFARSQVDVFASSHTCLPAMRVLDADDDRKKVVMNNGAAGMPNFAGSHFGVATRISTTPCRPTVRLYGTRVQDVHIDAVKVHYDQQAFIRAFNANWPHGSPACESYLSRLTNGPHYSIDAALGTRDHSRQQTPFHQASAQNIN